MLGLIFHHRLGDIINKFRENTLGLSSLTIANGPSAIDRLKIPWTYFISPALVSKPSDWKNNIGIHSYINSCVFKLIPKFIRYCWILHNPTVNVHPFHKARIFPFNWNSDILHRVKILQELNTSQSTDINPPLALDL